jgi:mono/diheme cytochrome c family protein
METSRLASAALVLAFALVLCMLTTSSMLAEDEKEVPDAEVPTVPDSAKNLPNPVPSSKDSTDNGKLHFSSQCTMCHGSAGDGNGDLVERLGLVMPDFTDPRYASARKDGELFYVLKNGHGRMPGQGERMRDNVLWDMVNYIRTLSAPAG